MTPAPFRILVLIALPCAAACTSLHGNRAARCGGIAAPEPALIAMSYYAELYRCEFRYCDNGPQAGSRLAVKACYPAAALHKKARDKQDIDDIVPRTTQLCGGSECTDR